MSEAARVEVDALGLLCPLPILRAEAALARERKAGRARVELIVWADDEGILEDLPRWCEGQGHALIELLPAAHPCGRTVFRGVVQAGPA